MTLICKFFHPKKKLETHKSLFGQGMVILSSPQQSERAEIGELCFRYVTMFLNVPVHHGQNKANKIFIANLEYLVNNENHNPGNIKIFEVFPLLIPSFYSPGNCLTWMSQEVS